MKPELRKQAKFIYFKIHNSTIKDELDSENDKSHSRLRESVSDINALNKPIRKTNLRTL
jgi:hypothetical protein